MFRIYIEKFLTKKYRGGVNYSLDIITKEREDFL